jgi:hypothetical protein
VKSPDDTFVLRPACGLQGQSVRIVGRWINKPVSPVLYRPCSRPKAPSMKVGAGALINSDPGAVGANLQNTIVLYHGDVRAIRRKYCGLIAVGCCLALDGPDDLIVGSAGSTGEVEPISTPSASSNCSINPHLRASRARAPASA